MKKILILCLMLFSLISLAADPNAAYEKARLEKQSLSMLGKLMR